VHDVFGLEIRVTATPEQLRIAAEQGAYRSFAHAAASIGKEARTSIRGRLKGEGNKPGPPGGPIRTKTGKGGWRAKRSIRFDAHKAGAVIGFIASRMGQSMEAHEHGATRGGVRFPSRPTMYPALERNLARFHKEWEGAI